MPIQPGPTPYSAADGTPLSYLVPRSADDLVRMGRCFSATTFLSAGNITHTPAYGHLIALGILATVQERNVSARQIADAAAYREMIAGTGRFLTFCGGGATIGYRLREDPAQRAAFRIVRETDAGLVISGKVGMHTSPAYAEEVFIGGSQTGIEIGAHRATFIVPVGAPGVTTVCRKIAVRDANPFVAPLSSRYDELDGQMWLDEVFIPWERIFLLDISPEPIVRWLLWHQLYCWLSKGEFTLGLALACTHAMGLVQHEPTIDYLIDLVIDVQTVRSCLTAAERDPQFTPRGYCYPNHLHLASGSIAILKARQRMSEIMRIVPGSSLVVAPTDRDIAAPEIAAGLEESFGGGGYTALQRAALLADGMGSRVIGAGRTRVSVRAARQRRHAGLARPHPPQLRSLQRAGQRGAAADLGADAGDRSDFAARDGVRAAASGHAAAAVNSSARAPSLRGGEADEAISVKSTSSPTEIASSLTLLAMTRVSAYTRRRKQRSSTWMHCVRNACSKFSRASGSARSASRYCSYAARLSNSISAMAKLLGPSFGKKYPTSAPPHRAMIGGHVVA